MAGLFFTSGCVDNEESEGVKELRMAQAALLQAEAQATVMAAEAEAAYTMAVAAVQEAIAQTELANARMREIQNELREAQDAVAIAILQAEMEYEIAKAVAEAEEALNAAEIALLASIRNLEVELAKHENELLKEYLDMYKAAMVEVLDLRGDLVDETAKLARYQIYVDGVGGDLVAEKLREQEKLENEVALMELYKAKLEVVLEDPAVTDEELIEAVEEVDKIRVELAKLEAEDVKLDEAEWAAWVALGKAKDEYDDVKDIVTGHPGVIDNWTNVVPFSDDIDDDDFDLTIDGTFHSKAQYEEWIANVEEVIANWQSAHADLGVTLANQLEVYQIHAAKLAELYDAFVTADEEYDAAEQAYQVAKAEYEADPTTENLTAMNDAEADRDAALIARNDALIEHDDYESTYYDPARTAVENTQDAIATLEDMIADAEEQIADWLADHAIVIDYIAYLQAELDDALAEYDDVKLAYTEAYDAYVLAAEAWDEIDDQIDDLELDLWYAEWYVNVLVDNYDNQIAAMDNIVEYIAETKAQLAELDITFASWESAIAAQEAKIAQLEAELAYWEEVAADYKVMFNGELGDE